MALLLRMKVLLNQSSFSIRSYSKVLARIEQSPDLNKPMAITLPRMSFEYTGMTYDPTRKVTQTQQIVVKNPADGTDEKKQFASSI